MSHYRPASVDLAIMAAIGIVFLVIAWPLAVLFAIIMLARIGFDEYLRRHRGRDRAP